MKQIFMVAVLAAWAQFGWGQEVSYQLSSHILDINANQELKNNF